MTWVFVSHVGSPFRQIPAILLTLCLSSLGCGPGEPQSNDRQPALPACVPPDLSAVSESVRRQILDRHARLSQILKDPNASKSEQATAHGDLGRLLMAAKFNDEAVNCYLHAEALALDDARWPYFVGHGYLRKGDRALAANAFERGVRLKPEDVVMLTWLGEAYLDDGRTDLALTTFEKAVAIQPQSAVALFGAGRAALARQEYRRAAEYLERALAAEPRASAIHYPLGMAYRALGDRDRAEAQLRQRGNAFPQMNDPLLRQDDELLESTIANEDRGLQALRTGDWATAAESFRRGLQIDPDDTSLRYWLGATLYASGDAAGAEREFNAVVRQDPGFAKAHFSLGAIYEASGRRPSAIDEYRITVRLDPNLPDARLRLAELLRASGQTAASFEQFEAAVKLDPGLADAWIGGARVLVTLGREKELREWIAQARRIHPDRRELGEIQVR